MIGTITIDQMMKINLVFNTFKDHGSAKLTKELLAIVTDGEDVDLEKGEKILNDIVELFNQEDFEVITRFEFNGREWGFIPSLDKIKTNEYIDLDYWLGQDNSAHKTMSILFRPITKKEGELYQIEPYEGTDKYSEELKGVDWKVYKGALVFFYHLRPALLNAIAIYTQREMKKAMKWKRLKKILGLETSQ